MACSLTSSKMLLAGSPLARRAPQPTAAARPQQMRSRQLVTRAAGKPEQQGTMQDFVSNAERVLARYDFVSAGMGALLVTGFCVSRGQDVGTALWITAAATIVALVVNDVMPDN